MQTVTMFSERFFWAFLLAGFIHLAIITGLEIHLPKPERRIHHPLAVTVQINPAPARTVVRDRDVEPIRPVQDAVPSQRPPTSTPVATRGPQPLEIQRKKARMEPVPPFHVQPEEPRKIASSSSSLPVAISTPQKSTLSADLLSRQVSELSEAMNRVSVNRVATIRQIPIETLKVPKYKAAAYEQAWQSKVERVGNLNYPEVARKNKLSGTLRLSVGINPDGTIHTITVRQSSGHTELDEAAARIVRLAAPYARFPDELRAEAEVLVITRTWRFYDDFRLETAP